MKATTSTGFLLAIMLLCTGAAARPIRLLQQSGGMVGYVPPASTGCDGLIVTVTAEKSDSRWWSSVPVIEGSVQLQNPKTYGIPVSNINVQAVSSDGQFYSGYATCNGAAGTYVPTNPVPYTYGTATCTYRIQLDNRVFGSYGSSTGSSGSSNGMVGYIPDNNSGYYPSHHRPTWTVQATATIAMNNAQCSSAPAAVNTSSWWSWFSNIIGSGSSGSSRGGSFGSSAPTGLGSSIEPVSATSSSQDSGNDDN